MDLQWKSQSLLSLAIRHLVYDVSSNLARSSGRVDWQNRTRIPRSARRLRTVQLPRSTLRSAALGLSPGSPHSQSSLFVLAAAFSTLVASLFSLFALFHFALRCPCDGINASAVPSRSCKWSRNGLWVRRPPVAEPAKKPHVARPNEARPVTFSFQ